jgi:hypothetical protein
VSVLFRQEYRLDLRFLFAGDDLYMFVLCEIFTCVVQMRPGLRMARVVFVLLFVTFFIGPNPL